MITRTQTHQFNKLPDNIKAQISRSNSGCWLWIGRINRNGYGRVRWNKRELMAHRVIWEILKGKIPDGLFLDHDEIHCGERSCGNPAHLNPVTPKVNSHRGKPKLFKKKGGV